MSQKKIQFHIFWLMAVFLCVVLFIGNAPTIYAAEGTCGDNLTWSFDGSTLTITGSGAMDNYTEENPAPWHEFRSQIIGLSLPEELTRIGTRAFAECSGLSVVNVPGTVQIIGESAFLECSSMTMLTLNEGIRTIGQCAFEQCKFLADVRLPDSLINLGNHAFYMCESLTYVTIPSYVKTIGSGVFSYCSNLVRADIYASIEMPSWSFYGCDKLEIVTIQGNPVEPESLKIVSAPQGMIIDSVDGSADAPSGPTFPQQPSPAPNTGFASGESITTDATGRPVLDQTTVTKTENATTTVTNRTPLDEQGGTATSSTTTTITATIQNNNGWNDVIEKVNSATLGDNSNTVNVTVYVPNSDVVSAEVLQEFAGKNVSLTIQTQSGSQFTLDCTKLDPSIKKDVTIDYTLVPMEEVPEELEGCTVYQLKFRAAAELSAELVIRLPGKHALSTATLYQVKGTGKLQKLQSVLVDPYGDAHWYVSAVDEKTEYLIGINVPGAEEESPIIPAALHDVYKVENVYDGVEYVVTGRSSSWGMNLGQVMGIMAAVMVGVIAIVGVVFYIWNKRRVSSGYVPGWDDMDDEDDD